MKLKRRHIEPLFLALVPASITGGPLFLALSSSDSAPSSSLELAVALAIGLVFIFRLLLREQREIDALRRQIVSADGSVNEPRHMP